MTIEVRNSIYFCYSLCIDFSHSSTENYFFTDIYILIAI